MEASPPPPEGALLHRARESAEITIAAAAKGAGITDTRWSQIERGHERRKGIDVPARAKAGTLARMARAIGISPERLESEGERPDAAEILREILRTPQQSPRPHPVAPFPAPATAPSAAAEVLAALLDRYAGDEVIQAIGTQQGKPAWMITQEVLRWLERQGDEGAARSVLSDLLAGHPGDEVLQTIGRQRGKKASMVTAEILEWLDWRPPQMEQANGTAG